MLTLDVDKKKGFETNQTPFLINISRNFLPLKVKSSLNACQVTFMV